jgi:hypothetical protein
MELLDIVKSKAPGKKYTAHFRLRTGKKHTIHFGAAGMDDYTLTRDKEQRRLYRERHAKDLETNDPTRAGFLSYYLLWGDSTSLRTNVAAYRRNFRL